MFLNSYLEFKFTKHLFIHDWNKITYVHITVQSFFVNQVAVKFAQKMPQMAYLSVVSRQHFLCYLVSICGQKSLFGKPPPSNCYIFFLIAFLSQTPSFRDCLGSRGPSCQNIIRVLDWQDDPDHYIMVMERPSPSMDMVDFLKLNGGVFDERIAQHMWQVIYAANVCCYWGVFHCDIKLENLLVNPNTLEVKLIDFGCGDLMKDITYD